MIVDKKFYIFNAGCIRRGLDCIWIKNYLEMNGWKIVNSPPKASLLVISTCGVVKKNELNSLIAVKKVFGEKNTQARTIITGCLSKINPEALNQIGEFFFVPSGSLDLLDSIVNSQIPINDVKHPDSVTDGGPITDYLIARSFCRSSRFYKKLFDKFAMNTTFLKWSVSLVSQWREFKHFFSMNNVKRIRPYYNIKIGDGCKSTCSYCATKFATEGLKSRPLDDILSDFEKGLQKGYRTFQLISEDTGCYGLDLGSSITELLAHIFKNKVEFQIVLIDFNPWWLYKQQNELIPLLVKNQEKVKEIFLPFQSGSDRILKLMNREYRAKEFISICRQLREKAPQIAIRTCALVGFPTETDDDFEATKHIIREIDFAEVAINRYEDRPNTASSFMTGKIAQDIIEQRAQFLVNNMSCKMLS